MAAYGGDFFLALTLWGFVLETLLYGLYLMLFGLSLYVHYRYALTRSGNGAYRAGKAMVALSFSLFALITTHWILGFFRFYFAVVVHGDSAGGTEIYLADLGDPTWIAQLAVYALSRILMDTLLVARLCVIWNSKLWITILPTATVAGDLLASTMQCYYAVKFAGVESEAFRLQSKWVVAAYSFSCCTNLIASILIIYRVVKKNRVMKDFNTRSNLVPVMMIVIESASIYTLLNVVLLVLFKAKSPGVAVALPFVNPLAGIVYALIAVQVGLGLSVLGRSASRTPTLHRLSGGRPRSPAAAPPVAVPLDTLKLAQSDEHSVSEDAITAKSGGSVHMGSVRDCDG